MVANWRLDKCRESPAAMLQDETARTPGTPHTLRVRGGSARYARSHVVRAYIPQIGYIFSFSNMLAACMYETESTAPHSSTAKTMQIKLKTLERKQRNAPPRAKISCLIGTYYIGQAEINKKLNSRASLSASYAVRPLSRPQRHRFGPGKAFLTLCHSEPCHPPRVKPGAHRGCRSSAWHCWCSDCVALSLNFSPVAKMSTA